MMHTSIATSEAAAYTTETADERQAERALRKAFSRMRAEAEAARMPDPNITEDVAAVTAAVRGASHSPPAARQAQL